MTIRERLGRLVLPLFAIVASLPLACIFADSLFGMTSALVVPVFVVAVLFTVISREPAHRIWWFAFACSTMIWLLVLSPLMESGIHGAALWLQRLSHQGAISLTQRVIEPGALASIYLFPPIGSVLTGAGIGRLVQHWSNLKGRSASLERSRRWQFSVRELLVFTFAFCGFLAIAFGRMRVEQAAESSDKAAFLARFENSFVTKGVQLLAEPNITGGHRALIPESGYTSFMPPGINEYRVTAPIVKSNQGRWAVWVYTCNGNHDDMIYQFAYAEADTEELLPLHPFPMKAYVNATWQMIDGVPN